MIDFKQVVAISNQIAKERGLDAEKVLEVIEDSLATAYRKEYGEKGEVIKVKIDPETGGIRFWQVKEVVDESTVRFITEEEAEAQRLAAEEGNTFKEAEDEEEKLPRYNLERHMLLDEAKAVKKGAKVGDKLEFPLEPKEDFGRIAAQSAKQVILQKLREADKEAILGEFKDKEGKIISGIIHRYDRGTVYVDLGRISGVLFPNESIPGEHYTVNTRMRFYVLAVQEGRRGQAEIVLSRSHPRFINKLFELEVPEIADGTVEIKAIAREAGSRTKIAVHSSVIGVDPIGSCVGQKGTRVMAVMSEIGQEKIDIIEWSPKVENFVGQALSPAKVNDVEIMPKHEVRVIVPTDQLSLAIGKGGQNVRLAARLTGWKIDVRSEDNPDEVQAGGIADTEGTVPVDHELSDDEISESPDSGVLIPKKEE